MMKFKRPITTEGSAPIWEMSDADLKNGHALRAVAARADVGDLVYVPLADASVHRSSETTRVDAYDEINTPERPLVRMHSERLHTAARVEQLRVALRSHGLELEDRGAFFWELVLR